MANVKEYNKQELIEMASHLSRKDVSSYNRDDLLNFVKDSVMKLKAKASKINFPGLAVFTSISEGLINAGFQLLHYAGNKVIFGIPSGKTGIKLVSITDASKKNRRKLTVYFGSYNLKSNVFELVNIEKGTRTCGSQNQMVAVIDNELIEKFNIDEVTAEVVQLAEATKENRYTEMKVIAAKKAAEKIDAKFKS